MSEVFMGRTFWLLLTRSLQCPFAAHQQSLSRLHGEGFPRRVFELRLSAGQPVLMHPLALTVWTKCKLKHCQQNTNYR